MDWEKYLKRLDQDMVLRSYSPHTRKVYGREVKNFLAFSGCKPVKEITEEDVRNYVLHLMAGSLSKETINTYQAAIRFFFGVTLNRAMNYLQMPRLKEDRSLPEIFSREEVSLVLAFCQNLKHKAMIALGYGSGLRVSEICALRVQDIDSKQMRVFVRCGKETMPFIERNLNDDEVIITMVDTNLQRDNILPSERAFALKMKMEALKHQGKRSDLGGCCTKKKSDSSFL